MKDTLLEGRYQLLDPIGSGGEAQVFRARDTATGTDVAARMALHPVTYRAPDIIPHPRPGWVRFLYWGFDPQYGAYQIFELLEGPTLPQLLAPGPLDSGRWRAFVDQSLDAVEALHVTGWVHGDLNAENFIQAFGASWKLLELPFLRFDPPQDRTTLFGSIYTLAPELFNGAPTDFLSDIYALGCLYYYAASGQFPHSGSSSQEIAIARLRFAPIPLSNCAPGLPAAWSAWVMHLLAFVPQDRPSTIAAARQMLGVA